MKKLFLLILFFVPALFVCSQTVEEELPLPQPPILADMPKGTVVQDSAVTVLMQEKIAGIVRGVVEMPGYRVQVYSSNRPAQAKQEAIKMEERLRQETDAAIYIVSAPPFIKVRLGDFRTHQEATDFKNAFIEQFPDLKGDTYVVRDDIKVRR
jgi:hypothetical protein